MSREAVPPQHRTLSIPGKIFLAGEYLALAGLPSILMALPPRFRLRRTRLSETETAWANESPVALLKTSLLGEGIPPGALSGWVFEDPFNGAGGFGASTAQFALIAAAADPRSTCNPVALWQRYRKLLRDHLREGSLVPSGADLMAQLRGGLGVFSNDERRGPVFEDLSDCLSVFHFVVFSAAGKPGRKTATHEHLASINKRTDLRRGSELFEALEGIVSEMRAALIARNRAGVGDLMGAFADGLAEKGLEHPDSHAERVSLSRVKGVLGVKGAGALLSDSQIVLVDNRTPDEVSGTVNELMKAAKNLGLISVSEWVRPEPGVCFDE